MKHALYTWKTEPTDGSPCGLLKQGIHKDMERMLNMAAYKSHELFLKWIQITGDMLTENLVKVLDEKGYPFPGDQLDALMEKVHATLQDAGRWLQQGKSNQKVPFKQVLAIAEAFEVDPQRLLYISPQKYQLKFAITRIIDDDETILKLFDATDKDGAFAYGEEVAQHEQDAVISLERIKVDKRGRRKDGVSEIFYVWSND